MNGVVLNSGMMCSGWVTWGLLRLFTLSLITGAVINKRYHPGAYDFNPSRWMWARFISTNLISLKWKTWLPKGPERADTENAGSTSLTKLHIVICAAGNSESTQLLKYAYAPVFMHKLDRFIKDHWNVSSLKHDQHYKHSFFLFAWGWKVDKSKEKIQ